MNAEYPLPARAVWEDGREMDVMVGEARTFAERFFGLMGKDSVPSGSGLLFRGCTSIHMFFMRVPLDIVWLGDMTEDGSYPVVSIDGSLKPWRMIFAPRGAKHVMEFRAGTFDEVDRPDRIHMGEGGR